MISSLREFWKQDEQTAPNIFAWKTTRPAPRKLILFRLTCRFRFKRRYLPAKFLRSTCVNSRRGFSPAPEKTIIPATGAASGKTLACNLPVLAALLEIPEALAILRELTRRPERILFTKPA